MFFDHDSVNVLMFMLAKGVFVVSVGVYAGSFGVSLTPFSAGGCDVLSPLLAEVFLFAKLCSAEFVFG